MGGSRIYDQRQKEEAAAIAQRKREDENLFGYDGALFIQNASWRKFMVLQSEKVSFACQGI
jgi:hypothetical protein